MGGDPAAVEAGAAALEGLSADYTAAGEDVRGAGRRMDASWLGPAASAAQASIEQLGSLPATPAEVVTAAGRALRTYAQALREAQQLMASAEAMGARAADAVLALADDPPSMQRDVAMGRGEADVAAAEGMKAQAVEKERQANQAAATAINGLTGRVDGMVIQAPNPGSPATYVLAGTPGAPAFGPTTNPGEYGTYRTEVPPPPPPPEDDGGWSPSDIGHTILDVGGLVPVIGEPLDGANAAWYAAEGDYLNAGLSAAGMVPFLGWGATATKFGVKGAKAAERLGGDALEAGVTTERAADRAAIDQAEGASHTAPDHVQSQGEPVDVGTGHLFLPAVDVDLPGALPLVLRRRHHSRWRSGQWFGPSWSSTLDEHLLVDDDVVRFAHEDAVVVTFAGAGPEPTRSTHDPRLSLRTSREGHVVVDAVSGRRRHFTGTGRHRWLTAVTDRSGRHRVDIVRGVDGTPREVRHSGGYRVVVHTALGRVTGFDLAGAGPDGSDRALIRFGYVAGNLTAEVNSSNLPTRFGYDEHGRMTGWVDRLGSWYRHTYDEQDRVVAQRGSGGVLDARYDYDDPSSTVLRADSHGHVTRFVHDARGRIVVEVGSDGARRETAWADAGPGEVRDALGRVTRWSYDYDGRVLGVEHPDGTAVTIRRDAAGDPIELVDADGSRWEQRYDAAGRVVAVVDPAGVSTTVAHDRAGSTTTDALGGATRTELDAAGLPVASTDPTGATTRWERDVFGRVGAVVDALGHRTAFTWTLEGRLASRTDPLGAVERRLYDPEGNLTTLTDAAGHVTSFEYGDFDLLRARTDPDGSRYAFDHDTERRLARVTNPLGLSWTYERDAEGKVLAEVDFDGHRRTWSYDAGGRVTARRNALGQEVGFGYDAADRLTERRADGVLATFDHDVSGRLVRAATPDVDLVLERDRLGRVTSEAVDGRAMRSAYDALGRRTRRETPTGASSSWSYDAASRPVSLQAGELVTFDRDVLGREVRRGAGAAVTEQEWDPAGRVVRRAVPGAVDRTFSYREDGYLTAVTTPTGSRVFDLDPSGRVTGVTGSGSAAGWTEHYRYDDVGTMRDAQWPTADPTPLGDRRIEGLRVRRAGRVDYTYDGEGRVVRRVRRRLGPRPDVWHYTWDALDRLVALTTPDGARWRYVYDALGRRVSKQRVDTGGVVVERVDFAWDDATLVEETATGPRGARTRTWDHDETGLRPLAERSSGRWDQQEVDQRFFAIVTDLVGAPTELLDRDGRVAGQVRRSLWGDSTWTGEATPLEFPGQYTDHESGLRYNVFRYYDTHIASYLTTDPLGLEPAPHPRGYVINPSRLTDALGLAPDGCGGGSAGTSDPPTHDPRFVQDPHDGSWVDTGAPGIVDQQNRVIDSLQSTGHPPDGILQGGSKGTFGNKEALLPVRDDPSYYRESRLWPSSDALGKSPERIVIGKAGEAYYTPDHYRSFRRLR